MDKENYGIPPAGSCYSCWFHETVRDQEGPPQPTAIRLVAL